LIPEPAVVKSIKTSDTAIPNVANVTVQVESRYNNDQTGSLHNNVDLIDSAENTVQTGYNGQDKGSLSDSESLVNRKVSFSGTTDVRTFDENGNYRSQKRNSVISTNTTDSNQSVGKSPYDSYDPDAEQAVNDNSTVSSDNNIDNGHDSQRLL